MLDWPRFQQTLVQLVSAVLRWFAEGHSGELFYGLFFDCDAYYGAVLVHLNTTELLRKRAIAYKSDTTSVGGIAVPNDLYAMKTISELENDLRWSGGDWSYFDIGRKEEWDKHWKPIQS